jgi:hypothetical protein
MKILMASTNNDDKAQVVLEFKKLNFAHVVDFVDTVDELHVYFTLRSDSKRELPNLLILDSSMEKSLKLTKLHSNLKELDVVLYTTHSTSTKNGITYRTSDELKWILQEICGGLARKQGWHYSIKPLAQRNQLQVA